MELDVGTELLRGTSGQGFDGGFVELHTGKSLHITTVGKQILLHIHHNQLHLFPTFQLE